MPSSAPSVPAELRRLDPRKLEQLPPEQRQRAAALLARVAAIREANPLALFEPYPKQHTFLSYQEKLLVKFFLGGNQTGKTTIGLADDVIQLCDREAIPEHLLKYKSHDPPFFMRLMTPDFTNTMEQVAFPKLRELLPKGQLWRDSWDAAYDKKNRVLHFKNDSWVQFATYEQDRDKLGGATLHRVHYDEEPPKGHRTESKIRLVRHGGQELFTLTPLEGLTWTYDLFWLPWESWEENGGPMPSDEEGNPIRIVQASMQDNPYLTPAARAFVLADTSPEERAAREHGKFIHLHGLIYRFNAEAHIVPEHAPPANCNIYVGIDPGIRYACAVVWLYMTPDGRMVVFDELKLRGYTIEQVCEQIHRVNALWGIEPMQYLIDPASMNRSQQTGLSDQDLFRMYGIVALPGQNDVRAGIGRVQTLMAWDNTRELDETNCPRLRYSSRCVELIAEKKRYRWREPPRTGEETREQPIKADDHLLDAERYVVMARPYAPEDEKPDTRAPLERKLADDIDAEWDAQERSSDYVI